MTVVQLSDSTLWCHPPIQPTPELLAELNAIGEVSHLVSPNKIHYAYISEWQKYYPNTIAWASPGVQERATKKGIHIHFEHKLCQTAPPEWQKDIEQLLFQGSRYMEEVVFFHKKSRTLILTDLTENFEVDKIDSCMWRHFLKFAGHVDPDGKTPIDLQMTFWGNKKQAKKSLEHIFLWNPDKIIISHGKWYPKNAVAELKRAFRWLN